MLRTVGVATASDGVRVPRDDEDIPDADALRAIADPGGVLEADLEGPENSSTLWTRGLSSLRLYQVSGRPPCLRISSQPWEPQILIWE